MNDYTFAAMQTKTITFKRLTSKNIKAYEIYATYKDDKFTSGLRTELMDTIENPVIPNPVLIKIELPYNDNATWKLPDDAYLDRDHQFRLFLNDFILSSMYYSYNRITKLITLDTVAKKYELGDKVHMEYYKDIITKTYVVEQDCTITIKPVFVESYTYGTHNVIQ